jgi:hypothetical protein
MSQADEARELLMSDEQLAREIAEKWIGPELPTTAMASGGRIYPPSTTTFTIKPHAQIVDELAVLIIPFIARHALEARLDEAKWWQQELDRRGLCVTDWHHERIRSLAERASKAAVGDSK